MSALQNLKHEAFVRHWRKTGNASKAYLAAGYNPTTRNSLDVSASRLLNHPKVQSRLRELERAMTHKTEITLEKLLSDLAEDRRQAKALGQMSAAMQATQLAAKLTGHLVERKETGGPGDFASLKTPAETLEAIRKEFGDAAAAAIEASLAASQAQQEASQILDSVDDRGENSLN